MKPARLALFLAVTFGWSWSLWLLTIASAHGWVGFHFPPNPFGSLGPLLGALVLAYVHEEPRDGIELLRCHWRRAPLPVLLAAVAVPLTGALFGLMLQAFFEGALPSVHWRVLLWLPLALVLVLVLGGPLGEEAGWRGVMVHGLSQRYSLLATSMIVGAVWILWHVPLFWMEGAAQKGSSILLFAVSVAVSSVLFTWTYLAAAPSLLPVLVLHTTINVIGIGLPALLPGLDDSPVYSIGFIGVMALAAAWCLRRPVLAAAVAQPV